METVIPNIRFCLRDDLDDSFLPTKADPDAAGWDVRAADETELIEGEYALIDLGIRAFIPDGWFLEIRPRSSTFIKKHIHCLYGVVDFSYENFIKFACQYLPEKENNIYFPRKLLIPKGERIGQLIPVSIPKFEISKVSTEEYESLCKFRGAKRGLGGFGSTGHF